VRVLGEEPDTVLVACVADGAGDSTCGEIGATLACESIVGSAAMHFETKRPLSELNAVKVLHWCEAARRKINQRAERDRRNIREYATTLSAAIVSSAGSVFFQIGDGAIIVSRNTALGVVFWPQSGEYVNTTNFLTAKEFRDHLQVFLTGSGFSDVALLTDGIERLALKFDSFTPHPPFFLPLFRALRDTPDVQSLAEDLRQFLQSDSVRSKTDDDQTLVLATRVDQTARAR
jgi:hypothetical protein